MPLTVQLLSYLLPDIEFWYMHQCILEIICIGYLKTSKKLYQTLHKAIFRAFEFDINSLERETP